MGYDKGIFFSEVPDVDGYECVICQDVVEDAVLCQQGHTCVRAASHAASHAAFERAVRA
jgi:hypothetical protein